MKIFVNGAQNLQMKNGLELMENLVIIMGNMVQSLIGVQLKVKYFIQIF